MAKKFETALIIKGDGKGGVQAVRANTQELEKFERQSEQAARATKTLNRVSDHFRANAGRYAFAVGAAVTGLVYLTQSTATAVQQTHAFGEAIGVSTGSLQAFQYAAEQVGIESDKALDIVKDLQDKIGDAAMSGGGELAPYLDQLGLSAERLIKMDPAEQLLRIGQAITSLPKAAQVTIMEAMADEATRLLPLMRDNGRLLRKYTQQARDFDIALTDADVQKLLRAHEATQEFSAAMRGLGNDIAIAVAPALAEAVENTEDLRAIITDPGFQDAIAALASALATSAGWLAEGTREFVGIGQAIGKGAAKIAGYSNELQDINDQLQRLQSMRNSTWMSRTGLFWFSGDLDTHISDADIDRYSAELKQRRAEIVGQAFSGEASGGVLNIGIDSDARAATIRGYVQLADEYDKRHEKLVQLRDDRKALQAAIADDPAHAEKYQRALTKVNAEIDQLSQTTRASTGALSDQDKTLAQLQADYRDTVDSLQRQIALFDKTGQTAQLRYKLEQGALATLDPSRKQHLLSMSRELQLLREQKQAVELLFPAWKNLERAQQLRASVSNLPPEMQAFGQRRADQLITSAATQGMPGMNGLDPMYNGAFGEMNRLERERQKYSQMYQTRLQSYRLYAQQHKDQVKSTYLAIEALNQQHQQRMAQYSTQIQKAQLAGFANMFGEMAGLTKAFAGEQSDIYKAMFAVSKAFSIAQSVVAIQTGIANALSLPFPENLAAAASVAAAAANIVSSIQAVTLSLSGQAHDGIDSIPSDGTWNLQKGERVIDRRTNADLKTYLSRANGGTVSRGGNVINFAPTVQVQARPGVSAQEANQQGRQIGEALRGEFRKLVVDEQRPGGLLAGTA